MVPKFDPIEAYERRHGTTYGEIDPTHHLNAGIVNLGKPELGECIWASVGRAAGRSSALWSEPSGAANH